MNDQQFLKCVLDKYADISLSNFDILKLVNNKTKIILYPDIVV